MSELNEVAEPKPGTLVFLCGKMGAGKSTRAAQIAEERGAVLISEDDWLSALYPDQIHTFDDFLEHSARLKPLIATHVARLLTIGTDVVMDFPANTAKQRSWFRSIVQDADAPHQLIYLRASDALCLRQIEQRSVEQPERAAFDTPAVFEHVTRFFEEPDPSEGFDLRIVERDG